MDVSPPLLVLLVLCCEAQGHTFAIDNSPGRYDYDDVEDTAVAKLELQAQTQSCILANYDLSPLASQESWTMLYPCVTANDSAGASANVHCWYYFSVCHPLPRLGFNGSADVCHDSAACLQRIIYNGPGIIREEWESLGSYDNYRAQGLPNYPEFQIVYHVNASEANDCRSILIFRCNESVSWSKPPGIPAQIIPVGALIAIHLFPPCSYIFQFHYDGACSTVAPSTKLTGGTYFIIVLYGIAMVYLLLGMAIRAAQGHRGWDLIPNRNVWNNIGVFVANGFHCLVSPCRPSSRDKLRGAGGEGTANTAAPEQLSSYVESARGENTPLLR